jgi:hypothetical protein
MLFIFSMVEFKLSAALMVTVEVTDEIDISGACPLVEHGDVVEIFVVSSIDEKSGSSENTPEIGGAEFEISTGDDGIISIESLELFLFVDESFSIIGGQEDFLGSVGVLPEYNINNKLKIGLYH